MMNRLTFKLKLINVNLYLESMTHSHKVVNHLHWKSLCLQPSPMGPRRAGCSGSWPGSFQRSLRMRPLCWCSITHTAQNCSLMLPGRTVLCFLLFAHYLFPGPGHHKEELASIFLDINGNSVVFCFPQDIFCFLLISPPYPPNSDLKTLLSYCNDRTPAVCSYISGGLYP